jgi:hypothetical protein
VCGRASPGPNPSANPVGGVRRDMDPVGRSCRRPLRASSGTKKRTPTTSSTATGTASMTATARRTRQTYGATGSWHGRLARKTPKTELVSCRPKTVSLAKAAAVERRRTCVLRLLLFGGVRCTRKWTGHRGRRHGIADLLTEYDHYTVSVLRSRAWAARRATHLCAVVSRGGGPSMHPS